MRSDLLTLIDDYARAAARRQEARELAVWAFREAHTAMLDAREKVADALGIPAQGLPPLTDETTQLANQAIAADDAWNAYIDTKLKARC